jgi:hypothetical protein
MGIGETTLRRLRQYITEGDYVVTVHAVDEMTDDDLTVLDVENLILSGQIVERQVDRTTGERKYVIRGHNLSDEDCCAVVKAGPAGKLVIITVYRE